MRAQVVKSSLSQILCFALLMPFVWVPAPAEEKTSEGVVFINQKLAMAGGITPGDAPGFPVTINVPGNYRLSGNLSVPNENTTGIVIQSASSSEAGNVTVDLNGFAINGVTICSGSGPDTGCSPKGTGVGIQILHPAFSTVTVRNGTVQGMGSSGIDVAVAGGGTVENISAIGNGQDGIDVAVGRVVDCTAIRNGGEGIRMNMGLISRNLSSFNRSHGVFGGIAVQINHNTVVSNGGGGISLLGGIGAVTGNLVRGNHSTGISLTSDSGYGANVLSGNNPDVSGGTSQGHNLCSGASC